MIRLYILVEGRTEETFTRKVLEPHLASLGIWMVPIIVASSRDRHGSKRRGGGDWMKWRSDLQKLTGQQRGADVRFTTLFDLFRLPGNFPGVEEHCSVADTKRRAELLEAAMAADINDRRLLPYLQRHEFEARAGRARGAGGGAGRRGAAGRPRAPGPRPDPATGGGE